MGNPVKSVDNNLRRVSILLTDHPDRCARISYALVEQNSLSELTEVKVTNAL